LKSSTFIRQSIINSGDTLLISDYDSFITNKKKAAENYSNGKRNKELEEQIILQERELVERSGAFRDFNKIKNIDWKIIRDGLKKDEVAIEFIHFRSEIDSLNPTIYAALVVKKESEHPEVVRLCTEEDLTSILGVFQGNNNSFVRKVYGIKSKSEKELYKKIWEPLNKQLEGVKRVYYSPSGLLHKISFAALSDGNDMYLCDRYELFQQSSTSKLANAAHPNYSASDNFMLIGGIQYNSTSTRNEVWSYLPGTQLEIASIARFLKQKKHTVNLFEGVQAKESTLKSQANQADILHVSTHGFFFPNPDAIAENRTNNEIEYVEHMNFRGTTFLDSLARNSTSYMNWNFVGNKNPLMRSGLVLAGANDIWQRDPLDEGEDGVLTAQEVSNLDLSSTKMVVLSACETGLGDIKGSEGVFGLQRAFKMAGAHYLIMSLWQVPDNETAEFMKLFYKNLTKKKDITLAFNLAQKEMRGKYDPYYWAAFVLVD
jgi:CHAT domain-containing protein